MGEVENIERQLLTSRKLGFILTNHVRILMRTACEKQRLFGFPSEHQHAEPSSE